MSSESEIKSHLAEVFINIEKMTGPMPDAFIAGGCIASLVLDEEVKDYDVWFSDPEDYKKASEAIKAKYPFEESKYALTFTLPDGDKVQLVQSRMGVPEVLVPKFDYKHTHSYYTKAGVLKYDEAFIKTKELVFVRGNFDHPVNTMQRMLKFQKRGYNVSTQTVMDLMKDIKEIKDENIYYSGIHGGSC